jgi:hypothetical protein
LTFKINRGDFSIQNTALTEYFNPRVDPRIYLGAAVELVDKSEAGEQSFHLSQGRGHGLGQGQDQGEGKGKGQDKGQGVSVGVRVMAWAWVIRDRVGVHLEDRVRMGST